MKFKEIKNKKAVFIKENGMEKVIPLTLNKNKVRDLELLKEYPEIPWVLEGRIYLDPLQGLTGFARTQGRIDLAAYDKAHTVCEKEEDLLAHNSVYRQAEDD